VIDIGIPGDEEHIELVPATPGHLLAAAGDEDVFCLSQGGPYLFCAFSITS